MLVKKCDLCRKDIAWENRDYGEVSIEGGMKRFSFCAGCNKPILVALKNMGIGKAEAKKKTKKLAY